MTTKQHQTALIEIETPMLQALVVETAPWRIAKVEAELLRKLLAEPALNLSFQFVA